MTSYPTLLGSGGHSLPGQNFGETGYYGNVGLGRSPMIGTFTAAANVSQIIRASGTISYLSWGLDEGFGGFGNTLTFALNVNSSSSDLAVSFDSDVTGILTDGTDSVGVSAGDSLCFAVNTGSGDSDYGGSFYCASARFDAATASAQMLATVGSAEFKASALSPTQNFINFLGILNIDLTSESEQQFYCLSAGTWRNMALYVENNALNASATFHNRKNGSNGMMAISLSDTDLSGYFEDTSSFGSESVGVGDLLDYVFSTSATSDSIGIDWIGAHFVATTSDMCMIGGTPTYNSVMVPTIDSGDTVYSSLFGGGNQDDTPDRSTGVIPYDLSASMFTNYLIDSSAAATFTLLRNGSPSGLAVSAGYEETGYFMTGSGSTVDFDAGDTCANRIAVTGGEGENPSVTWDGASLLLTASS